jgi:uncharacterized SAM-binding protein YcdF (DUF218 family)
MFLLKKVLSALLLPPTSLLLLALCGLWLARRRPRLGHGLIALGVGTLLLLATPAISNRLLQSLETARPITPAALASCQAIVVLGAGTYYRAPEYGGDTVNGLALERLRYAARLARTSGLPLAVTGGAPLGGRPEGESMREALHDDFGLPVRWVETASRDTAENAAYLAPMLKAAGVARIALVSHVWHLPRARELFQRQGLSVIAAPTGFTTAAPQGIGDWLPGVSALNRSWLAVHEWLGRRIASRFTVAPPAAMPR